MSAFGGKADLFTTRSACLLIARSGYWTTARAGKWAWGLFPLLSRLLLSQHLDQCSQVFLANSRRDGAFEDA